MKSDEIFKDNNSLQQFSDKVFNNQTDVTRIQNEEIIWRNILFYSGEQYLEYMRSTGSFRRRRVPDYLPTPVSNEIREFVRSTKALLMNQKMVPRVWPNTNEKEDRDAADLGENLMIWMDQTHDKRFFDEVEKVCIWLCLAGTGFIRAFPDANGGQWVNDGEEIWKTGDIGTKCVLPFNIRLDTLGDQLGNKRYIGIMSLEDPEWVEDTFKTKIERNRDDKTFIDYQKRLSRMVSDASPWKGKSLNMQNLDLEDEDSVLFKEIEFKPTIRRPNGYYCISCGNKIIYKRDRLPIRGTPEEWYYTLTDFHFNFVPGRFWSDAAVNDLISPQITINEIDQAFAINRKGLARPTIFMPGEVGLKKVEMGGHGFNMLSYNPIMGAKPQIESGTALPAQVLEERKFQKQQMQDSGGDPKNVLRGAPPSAQSSGIQIDILRETVERGKAPDIDRFNRSLTEVYKKRLLLAQEIYQEERLIKVTGRGNKVKIKKFKSSDLRGNTDVRLELDSGLLATKAGQTQVLLEMIRFGVFGDLAQNPTMKEELFRRFGMVSFSDEQNYDIERAERENMEISSGDMKIQLVEVDEQGQTTVVNEDLLFKYDNHATHFEIHKKFSLSTEFSSLPAHSQVILMAHMDAHRIEIDNVKPDMRQFVQIDKLYPFLTRNEQVQILEQIGIKPDMQGSVAGLPEAGKAMQVQQHLQDTKVREDNKAKQILLDAAAKADEHSIRIEESRNAIQSGKTVGG